MLAAAFASMLPALTPTALGQPAGAGNCDLTLLESGGYDGRIPAFYVFYIVYVPPRRDAVRKGQKRA